MATKNATRKSEEQLDREVEMARSRGEALRGDPMRAIAATVEGDAVHVTFQNGVRVAVPIDLIPQLAAVDATQRASVRVGALGGLLFPDADYAVDAATLVMHVFDGDILRSAAAGVAGRARSDAKAAASRANGAKGGRPPKVKNVVAFSTTIERGVRVGRGTPVRRGDPLPAGIKVGRGVRVERANPGGSIRGKDAVVPGEKKNNKTNKNTTRKRHD